MADGLAWDLAAALAPGASVGFTIYKPADPLTPEPTTLLLLAGSLAWVAARKVRRFPAAVIHFNDCAGSQRSAEELRNHHSG